jgi:endo-1,4-beta-xylanase
MLTRRTFLSGAGSLAAASLLPRSLPGAQPEQAVGSVDGAGSLRAHATARGLFYGAAVDTGMLRNDPAYRALLAQQCNIVVAENSMKWAAIHPEADRYAFEQADELLAFAEQHQMQVRGHNLCWHEALPSWFASTVNPGNARQILTGHIRTVAGRYQGRIRSWDVVNEAISLEDGRTDGLRVSPWFQMLGPGYIDLAFRTAREADPHALLTYNDYGIEYDHPASFTKRAAVMGLLKRLTADGVPIDAVGIQSHIDATTSGLGPGITAFVTEARTLGLKVFITELDVNDDNLAADDPATREAAVAEVYGQYVTDMVANPAVAEVLTWGISNNHSWLNNSKTHKAKHPGRQQQALPFDANYQPTPAFYALRSALDSRKG